MSWSDVKSFGGRRGEGSQCRVPSTVFVQRAGGQGHRGDVLAQAVHLHARQLLLLALGHQAVELGGAVADQSPQVAHKLVDEALALHLADHVPVVVIPAQVGKRELQSGGFSLRIASGDLISSVLGILTVRALFLDQTCFPLAATQMDRVTQFAFNVTELSVGRY